MKRAMSGESLKIEIMIRNDIIRERTEVIDRGPFTCIGLPVIAVTDVFWSGEQVLAVQRQYEASCAPLDRLST